MHAATKLYVILFVGTYDLEYKEVNLWMGGGTCFRINVHCIALLPLVLVVVGHAGVSGTVVEKPDKYWWVMLV